MTRSERLEYHGARASRELHLGLTAASAAAARAHLKLSALHFEKVRELGTVGRSRPVQPEGARAG